MRFTNKLYAQHLGWMFRKHWQVQGKRVPRDTGALAELGKLGVEVKDPQDILKVTHEFVPFEFTQTKPNVYAEDETHPNWQQQVCHIFGNENVLLEGLTQAQVLTNTLEISGFPKAISEGISKSKIPSVVDKNVQNAILASNLFDAEQVKLPKRKLEDRPTINLPREYGISSARKNRLLVSKLLMECEKVAGHSVASRRKIVDNATFKVTIPRGEDLLQFSIVSEKLLTANRPLEAVKGSYDGNLPDLYPMKCTITIPKKNIYTKETVFPLSASNNFSNLHTLFLHFDKEHLKNVHGTEVNSTQFQSRTMLKAFGAAAARAHQLYGDNAFKKLEKPIVVQSIQTDGRVFHFGVFQLNTLSLADNEGIKNYWFHQPEMELFAECAYKEGRPHLSGFNKDVFRCLNAFYNNS